MIRRLKARRDASEQARSEALKGSETQRFPLANRRSGSRLRRTSGRGFTLVEMLIVVAILGILANMITPVALDQLVKARAATVVSEYQLLQHAFHQFVTEEDALPRSWFSLSEHPDLAPYLDGRLTYYDPKYELYKWYIRYPDSFSSTFLSFRSGYIIYSFSGTSRIIEAIEEIYDGPIEVLSPGRVIVLVTEPA